MKKRRWRRKPVPLKKRIEKLERELSAAAAWMKYQEVFSEIIHEKKPP